MQRRNARLAALLLLAGCTNGAASSGPPVVSPNIAQTSKLQLAVGTATIAYSIGPNPQTTIGTNFVATFRGPDGNNATGANTPTLSGPPAFDFGPRLGNGNTITGETTPQLEQQASPQEAGNAPLAVQQGFGPFVGVFGYGFADDNIVSSQLISSIASMPHFPNCFGLGSPQGISILSNGPNAETAPFISGLPPTVFQPAPNVVRSDELGLPLLSGVPNGSNGNCPSGDGKNPLPASVFPINYYGGPPSWPSPEGYGNAAFFLGYPVGFTDMLVKPVAGTYRLSVAYPTNANYSTFGSVAATAAMKTTVPLPPLPSPALTVNSDGSGSVRLTIPPGLLETIVFVRSPFCNFAAAQTTADNYAIVTRGSGPQTLTLGANLGPPDVTGHPTHTFCTVSDLEAYNAVLVGDNLPPTPSYDFFSTVSAVGFDYPAFEGSYPQNVSQAPAITNGDGHSGQADVTTSFPVDTHTVLVVPGGMGMSHR